MSQPQGPEIIGVGEEYIQSEFAHGAALVRYPDGTESVIEVRSDIFEIFTETAEFAFAGLPPHLTTGEHLRVAYDRPSGTRIIEVDGPYSEMPRVRNEDLIRYVVGCAIGITSLSDGDYFVEPFTPDMDYRWTLNFPKNDVIDAPAS